MKRKRKKSMSGTEYTKEACSSTLMYKCNDKKSNKMVIHLVTYKGNEKKRYCKRKKERKRTEYNKSESNVRPTQLVRLK